ncbi:MAG: 4Fe-4S binding protein, partial [candidate division NC10 bacterium]|nr:4Fe-4S binding protein [candidate division NC10 bacterium]
YVSGQRLAASTEVTWVRLDHARQALLGPPVEGPRLPRVYPGYRAAERREPPTLPIDRRIGIAEVELKYPDAEAQAQARRCVRCGIHPIFDATKCILCGGCVDICPEYCLRMVPLSRIAGDQSVEALVQALLGHVPSPTPNPQPPTPASRAAAPAATAMLMDPTRCIRCALCAIRCPTGAISMEAFRYAETWVSV